MPAATGTGSSLAGSSSTSSGSRAGPELAAPPGSGLSWHHPCAGAAPSLRSAIRARHRPVTPRPVILDPNPDPHLARARALLSHTPLVDGHNDLPFAIREWADAPGDVRAYDLRARAPGRTDLARLAQGRVGAQFWSVYVPCRESGPGAARYQLEQIAIAKEVFATYPDVFAEAYGADDVYRIFGEGRIACLLGIEGGHAIEGSLGALRAYFHLGIRYMTLTHDCTTAWADAAQDEPRHGGLAPFGVAVVREMQRLGMLVDLSHTAPTTMNAVLDIAEAPVIWSHAGARARVDHPRNVPDAVLRRVPDNGGVVMITFVPAFVSRRHHAWDVRETAHRRALAARHAGDPARAREEMTAWRAAHPMPTATLGDVADHVEHVRDVAGPDHVGIGGDLDGTSRAVAGLEDVGTYPALFAELSRRGWSDRNLAALAGGNILRALRAAEEAASVLSRTRPPGRGVLE